MDFDIFSNLIKPGNDLPKLNIDYSTFEKNDLLKAKQVLENEIQRIVDILDISNDGIPNSSRYVYIISYSYNFTHPSWKFWLSNSRRHGRLFVYKNYSELNIQDVISIEKALENKINTKTVIAISVSRISVPNNIDISTYAHYIEEQ